MTQQIELEIAPREVTGKATKHLRQKGIIPANISGHKETSQAVQVDAITFERLRRHSGGRKILVLRLPDDSRQTALIRQVQHDPCSGKILHVDFDRVSLSERITLKVALHFIGESPAVKNKKAVLLHLMEALEVECLASDIIEYLEVDISPLVEIDDALHGRDVKLPTGFTLISDPDEPIAKVAATRAEVTEETAAEEAATPAS